MGKIGMQRIGRRHRKLKEIIVKDRLSGRRIIVFGSASGIGAATVRRLVQEGAKVGAARH